MAGTLAPSPLFQTYTQNGLPNAFGTFATFAAGTSTPIATYTDSTLITPNPNPATFNAIGQIQVWLTPGVAYKFQWFDQFGNQLGLEDNILAPFSSTIGANLLPTVNNTFNIGGPGATFANGYFGTAVFSPSFVQNGTPVAAFPATAAETATGLTLDLTQPYGNMARYKLVPNSVPAAAQNLVILNTLFNGNAQPPSTNGPTGEFYFPNVTGTDIYTVGVTAGTSPTVACRPGIRIRGNNVTINVAGTSSAVDVNVGFLYALSDFVLEDITINSNVDTTLGNNAAACLQFGARGAGFYFGTVNESTWAPSFGRIFVRNVILTTTNTGANSSRPIQILGGHSNLLIENYNINCNAIAGISGIYYEFGYWSGAGGAVPSAGVVTTHAKNMRFINGRVLNSTTFGIDIRGCYNSTVENLYTNGCAQCLSYSPGQAMFFNVSPNDAMGAKRNMRFVNLVGQGCTVAPAVALVSSNAAIAGVPVNAWDKTDLMTFSVDGVSAATLTASGSFTLKNANLDAAGAFLNPLTINDDVRTFEVTGCRIVNGTGSGVRLDVAGVGAWSPVRQKFGLISKCLIAGNVTSGIELNNVQAIKIEYCQLGFNVLNDPANEATQNIGVLVSSGCNGVICDNDYVTTSGGNAYSITGALSNGCNLLNPMGTVTRVGSWDVNGVSQANLGTASTGSNVAGLANKNTYPNAANKYAGKTCFNQSNSHLYTAAGPLSTDNWVPVDLGDTTAPPTITPA